MALQEKVRIHSENGLHARPITKVVTAATKLTSTIHIMYKEEKVSAKSMIGMMKLGVRKHEEVIVEAEGKHEKQDLEVIIDILKHAE